MAIDNALMAIGNEVQGLVRDDILESGLPNAVILNIRLGTTHVVHPDTVPAFGTYLVCIRVMADIFAEVVS